MGQVGETEVMRVGREQASSCVVVSCCATGAIVEVLYTVFKLDERITQFNRLVVHANV